MNTLFRLFAVIFILCIADVNNAYTTEGNKKEIEIVVHRGANFLAPENTIPSAFAALKHGATWIELDVRKSKDGVMYNLHDETLDRTTNSHGPISMAISSDIDKLDAGSWFSPAFKGVKVPRIETMLDTLKGKANVFFDVKKGTSVSNLVELVRKKGFANNSFFWFADPQMIPEFVKIAPEMKIKVNASDIEGLKKMASRMQTFVCRNQS
ncbi:glycerophosphodiester phosphodiesterase family protein [uncultured Bacteroides sp.]|uniref:glycerophosphodiester phosphodiesterase family protein n=1 Tax=uncultured Bacteroides sp. TaxID=162156 RepID=UPI00260CFB02|nr:glycerophosphodiester phosphodiesterase family protein [uncultured Bacteroides sp.]